MVVFLSGIHIFPSPPQVHWRAETNCTLLDSVWCTGRLGSKLKFEKEFPFSVCDPPWQSEIRLFEPSWITKRATVRRGLRVAISVLEGAVRFVSVGALQSVLLTAIERGSKIECGRSRKITCYFVFTITLLDHWRTYCLYPNTRELFINVLDANWSFPWGIHWALTSASKETSTLTLLL